MRDRILYIVIVVLVTILLLKEYGCGEKQGTKQNFSDTTTTRTEIVDCTHYFIGSHNIYIHDSILMFVSGPIDSSAVIKDYFTQRFFTDSFSDTNLHVKYSGMLWKNSLFNPNFEYQIRRPQTIITNTIIQPAELRNKIYVGGFLSFRNPEPTIGALLSFQNKRDRILTVGYGTGPTYLIGAQWKLSFKKIPSHPP